MDSNCQETGKGFDLREGHIPVSRRLPLNGDARSLCRSVPASPVSFGVDQLLSMDEARARIFSSECPPGLAFDAMDGDLRDVELVLYQKRSMATTETLLICPSILQSMFSIPSLTVRLHSQVNAVRRILQCLRTLDTWSVWRCRTSMLLRSAILR